MVTGWPIRQSKRDGPPCDLPDDTRLWALLQKFGGGTWSGCVYDVDAIERALNAASK
jgi:xylonate dehydratase